MNKKGFTLIELIAVITLFSIISLLVFGALTGSIKSASVKEMEVYVETNLEKYTLDSPGNYIVLKGSKIIEAGYLDKSIKNPSSCPIEEVNIRIYMESDYTLSYAVYCDGEEPPLSGDAEPIEPETPVTPETPSQTLYVFEYTGSVQEVTLPVGNWKLEVWGAQGGTYLDEESAGGAGGYSVGTLKVTEEQKLYIYVGGQPESCYTIRSVTPGGFNGGGEGYNRDYNVSTFGQGGGGATDIRIGQDSLYSRVIVAGGGGGHSEGNDTLTKYGGGASSGSPSADFAATQIKAGLGGSFGVGASTTQGGYNYSYGSGGGGGGWYGGGACPDYSDSESI